MRRGLALDRRWLARVGLPVVAALPLAVCFPAAAGAAGGAPAASGPGPWSPPLQPVAATSVVHRASPGDEQVLGTAVGPSGQIVVAGTYKGAGVLGVSPSQAPLPWASGSQYDLFVASYDAGGTLQWVRTATGAGDDRAVDVAVDGAGDVFVGVTTTSAPMTFDDGVTTAPSGSDVVKLSSAGVPQWAVPLGKGGPQVVGDGAGGVFVAGVFTGTATFGTGASAQVRISAGSTDVYVARLDATGALTWVARGGGPVADTAADVDLAADGGPTVAATVGGAASFRGGSGAATLAAPAFGGDDVAVAHWSASGAIGWVGGLGGPGSDRAAGVDARPDGVTRVVGRFEGTATAGAASLVSAGAGDGVLAELDGAGSVSWAARSGGVAEEQLVSVAADGLGNPVVLGTIGADGTIAGPSGVTQALLNDTSGTPTATSFLAGFAGTAPSWTSVVHRADAAPGGPVLRNVVPLAGGGVAVGGTISGTSGIAFGEGADAPTTAVPQYGDVVVARYPQPAAAPAIDPPACAEVAWVGRSTDSGPSTPTLWIGDPAGSIAAFPGAHPYAGAGPWWSPDGSKLVWLQDDLGTTGAYTLVIANSDATGPITTLGKVRPSDLVGSWAPSFSTNSLSYSSNLVAWVSTPGLWSMVQVAPVDGSSPTVGVALADRGTPLLGLGGYLYYARTISGVSRIYTTWPTGGASTDPVSFPPEQVSAPLGIQTLTTQPAGLWIVWGSGSTVYEALPSTVPEERIAYTYAATNPQQILLAREAGLLAWNELPGTNVPRIRVDSGVGSTTTVHGWVVPPAGAWGIVGQDWSPDATKLAFTEPPAPGTPGAAARVGLGTGSWTGSSRLVPRAPFTLSADGGADWSPDGQHLAFTGAHGAFIVDRNGTRAPRRIGPGGGGRITWSPLSGGSDLDLEVTAPASVPVGSTGTTTITVTNRGRCASTGALVAPSGSAAHIALTGGSLTQGSLGLAGWQVGPLAPGASATLTLQWVGDAATFQAPVLTVTGTGLDGYHGNDQQYLRFKVV